MTLTATIQRSTWMYAKYAEYELFYANVAAFIHSECIQCDSNIFDVIRTFERTEMLFHFFDTVIFSIRHVACNMPFSYTLNVQIFVSIISFFDKSLCQTLNRCYSTPKFLIECSQDVCFEVLSVIKKRLMKRVNSSHNRKKNSNGIDILLRLHELTNSK